MNKLRVISLLLAALMLTPLLAACSGGKGQNDSPSAASEAGALTSSPHGGAETNGTPNGGASSSATDTPATDTPDTPTEQSESEKPPAEDPPEGVVASYDISEKGSRVMLYICRAEETGVNGDGNGGDGGNGGNGENGGGNDSPAVYRAVVTGTGYMMNVPEKAHPWAEYSGSIISAYIGGGVKNICNRLFTFEQALRIAVVEPGVESVGMDAFAYCPSLSELYIPETVGEIGQGILYGSSIDNVYLGYDFLEDFREIALRSNYNFSENGSLPLDHAHYELSFRYGDVPDGLDRSARRTIGSQNRGYQTIFRVKTSEDLLFSPEIDLMRDYMKTPEYSGNVGDYSARLRITATDAGGKLHYTFPILTLPLHESKGGWFDIFFQGRIGDTPIDAGFCPQPGRIYDVFMEVLDPTGTTVLFAGRYERITAPASVSESKYFKEIAIPGEDQIFYTVRYEVKGGGFIEGENVFDLPFGASVPPVRAAAKEGYVFLQWSDGQIAPERTGDAALGDLVFTAEFVTEKAMSAAADVYIVTESGRPVTHQDYEAATVRVSAGDGSYTLPETAAQIRGRGNSSWNGGAAQDDYDSKNSYKLKLENKEGLLGMSPARKWVLLSNKFDAPGLRTWSMWKFAELTGTIPYFCDARYVNLYVNGMYRGMYLLCEQIEVKKGRVEIEEGGANGDYGFLIEIDFRGSWEKDAAEGLNYFYIDGYAHENKNGPAFVIKNDENITFEKTDAIKEFLQECSDAILSGDRARIEELVDLASLVDMYIIEEFSLDVDAGSASFFLQRDAGGKLFFTAPWDFDFGFGTYGPACSTEGFYSTGESGCVWYNHLILQAWFRQAVYDRMKELDKEVMPVLYRAISEKGEELFVAGDRSARFWNLYGRHIHGYVSGRGTADVYSYEGYVEFLLTWMETRWRWMEENILLAGG